MSVGLDDISRGRTNSITASGTSRDWHQYGPPSLQSQTYQALKAPSKRAFDCQTKPQHQDFSKMIKRSKNVLSVCCAASEEMLPETKTFLLVSVRNKSGLCCAGERSPGVLPVFSRQANGVLALASAIFEPFQSHYHLCEHISFGSSEVFHQWLCHPERRSGIKLLH